MTILTKTNKRLKTPIKMSGKMSGKNSFTTRTIQRDIAYLQIHDIIKREGVRKEGRWIVLRSSTTSIS